MMSEKKENSSIADQHKQITPMPGEIDPKNAKIGAFAALQKAKNKLKSKRVP